VQGRAIDVQRRIRGQGTVLIGETVGERCREMERVRCVLLLLLLEGVILDSSGVSSCPEPSSLPPRVYRRCWTMINPGKLN
jgi:hypothetical protein